MFTVIIVTLLTLSIVLNITQLKKQMKSTVKGRAALEAIAELSNYVQQSVVSAEKLEDLKTKMNSEALKVIAQQSFLARGVALAIRKDLVELWAKGSAKIRKIL